MRNREAQAARNEGLRQARGDFVAYLDVDDEFCPDYLAHVAHFRDKGEVLVFAYDIVQPVASPARSPRRFDWSLEGVESGQPLERVLAWEPARVQGNLFAMNMAKPLGVAHRRDLYCKVGGFNELVWAGEDWDFWKRLARAGIEFLFLPLKSGRYHVCGDSAGGVPHLTARQRETVVANWEAGRPIFELRTAESISVGSVSRRGDFSRPNVGGTRLSSAHPTTSGLPAGQGTRKIAYVAPHCLIDPTSGAAVATAQGMRFLQTLGFQCRAFCGSRLDLPEDIETMLQRHQIAYRRSSLAVGNSQVPVLVASLRGFSSGGSAEALEVTIFPNEIAQQTDFYRACGAFLDADRPDAVVTYGGDPLAETLIRLAKNRDLPLVFWLHNFAYHDPRAFALADYVIVPSQFNRRYYWESIGLASQVMPLVVDWERVRVDRCPHPGPLPAGEGTGCPHPAILPEAAADGGTRLSSAHPTLSPLPGGEGTGYVTFINPQRTKGLYVFARIAEILSARRPDIPLLVMAGRSQGGWQDDTGIDLARLPNLTIRPSQPDPRELYAATKLLLMPSLWNESFGLVAAEAMLNGIPVLASNRGALPETIGDAGFLFDIPARYTPETREVPMAAEVEPWIETILRLWDNPAEYGDGAALPASVPGFGIRTALGRSTANSSPALRISRVRRWCRA